MNVDVFIKESKYPIDVKIIFKDGVLLYVSSYNGNNISTFNSFQEFYGKTLEESILKVHDSLVVAINEMMLY